jgi:glycosyltransferase involved in cell wall biosynthesis
MKSPEPDLQVALFLKEFLEPTHLAIAFLIAGLRGCRLSVYAKRISPSLKPLENVTRSTLVSPASPPSLAGDRYDLVHAIFDGDLAIAAAAAARQARLPFILSFHGGFDVYVKIHHPDYTDQVRRIAQEATAVTVVCHADRKKLGALGIQRRIDVVPVPIDPALLPARAPAEPGRLILMARLVEKKGVDTAIRALQDLPEEFRLTIVGDGPLEPELRRQARALRLDHRIDFTGSLPLAEALQLVSRAEVLLHPGRVARDGNAEGTPQTILWAQAMEVPVLACDTGSLQEIVAHRRTGLLVPPDQPASLARAVLELRADPVLRRRIVDAAKHQITRRHQLSAVSARMSTLYRRHAKPVRKRPGD